MKILGRADRVDLPHLGLFNIKAKVDTGAYSCSLHCQRAQVVDRKLEVVLLDEEHPEFTGMKFIFDDFVQKNVRNSSGILERRYVIKTPLTIHGEELLAEFSLSDRDNLRFPILIGRKILRGRFLVDVTKRNLSYREKRKAAKGSIQK
jgi:hypothetical protein